MGIDTIPNTTVVGDRPERDLPIQQDVSFGEVAGAVFQDDHTVVNLVNDLADWAFNDFAPDPDYDPAEELEGYEGYADSLIHAQSREEMALKKQRIDDELAAKETIAAVSGLDGFGASALVAVTDPVSWIPIGGPAYKTYRTGGKILEGAAKTAGVAAIIETGREAYMQETQATRTFEQSAGNIASVMFLTGILGGAAGALSPKQAAELTGKIDADMTIPTGNGLSSVGAAQVGTTAEQELVKGLNKTQAVFRKIPDALTNPVYRGSTSESKVVRQITEQLADTSLIKNKNTEFIASATSVENKIKAYDSLKLGFYRDFTPQWRAYRKRIKEQKAAGGIPANERIGSKKDGSLTWREFGEEVTKAGRRNDEHVIPEISATAKSVRNNVYDPLKTRMVDTGLLDDMDIEIKTADSWVRRMWNTEKILADRQNFKEINLAWLRKKRDNAALQLEELKTRFEFDDNDLFDLEDLQIKREEFRKKNFGRQKDAAVQNKLREFDKKITQIGARLPEKADLELLRKTARRAQQEDFELDDIADQLIDRIAGLPGGRLGYDIRLEGKSKGPQKVGARGSAKQRVYDIPDELVEDYLVNDVHAIVESHVRTTSADAELMDTFGTLDFDVVKRRVAEDYQQLIARAGDDAKKLNKLEAAKRKDIRDLQAMWDKLRGLYAQPDDYAAPQHVAERGFLAWNYARLLGGMTLSAVPDMGRHVMVHGMQRTMNDGILAMIQDFKGWKYAVEDLREASVGLDMALSTTARARANIDEFTPVTGKVDAVSQTIAQNFGNVTLMNQWNTAQKTFAGILTQTRMMRAIEELGVGKTIGQKEIENLASHGIDREMAGRIAKQFRKHGQSREKLKVPNARAWDDVEAANTFRAAVRKQVDEIIVTPGLDRPLWMSRPGWRLVGQFRSFAFASMQRVTMAGLQQGDAAALGGVMMMIGMGAMVYGAKTALAGRELSDDPRVWLTEGIDRSGITGWFFDANNIVEKATRGTVGVNALVGGPQMSRYASRNVIDSIAGPTLGLSHEFFKLTGSAFSGDWRESDTHAMRRLLPYQNVIYLRSLFDQMENGTNKILGTEQ